MASLSIGDEVRFATDPEMIHSSGPSVQAYHPDYTRTRTPRQRKLRMQVFINRQGLTELNLTEYDLRQIPEETFNFHRLEVLKVAKNRLHSIPNNISHLRKLKVLDAHQNVVGVLTETITNCIHLREIDLSGNRLSSLPNHVGSFRNLKVLNLARNQYDSLPHELGEVESLTVLELSGNKLWHLPFSFQNLTNLRRLDLSDNAFDQLPICICSMRNLETLDLRNNKLMNLPNDMDHLKYVKELNLSSNRFETIPYSISGMKALQMLDLSENKLKTIPARMSKCTRLRHLSVQNNAVGYLPNQFESLEYLNLSDNRLQNFSVARMRHLQHLNASHNRLENLPLGCYNLPNLQALRLNTNKISYVSQDIVLLKKLRTLDLGNNRLTSLPSVINEMEGLETFNVRGNKLDSRGRHRRSGRSRERSRGWSRSRERSHEPPEPHEKRSTTRVTSRYRPLYRKNKEEVGTDEDVHDEAADLHYGKQKPKKPHHYSKKTSQVRSSSQGVQDSGQTSVHQYKASIPARGRPPLDYNPKTLSMPSFFSYAHSSGKTPGGASEATITPPAGHTSIPANVYNTLPVTPSEVTYPMELYSYPERSVVSQLTAHQYTQDWLEEPGKHQATSIRSNAATVNDTVGDGLSLGEEDHEYQPVTVPDQRLLNVCHQVEALLNKQLLHPIIHRGIFKKGLNEYGTLRTLNGIVRPQIRGPSPSHHPPMGEEPIQVNEEIFMQSPDETGVPELLERSKPDRFEVTPAGGQFRSTVDPNVSIYFPVKAVVLTTTLHMQIEKVNQNAVQIAKKENELIENIVSMGNIVHIHLDQKGAAQFNEQVTLTIPAPPVPKVKKGHLQMLTFLEDKTCTPCLSPFKSYKGYITLQCWHFSGKGAVLTESRDKYKACKAVEQLLESMPT